MEDDQQFCLRWNNHQSTLIQNFDTLLESGTLVDCTLATEGKYLKAHKVVLSACSPYFEGLLSEHYDKHPVFILKDVKFKELKAMMDYMYRGEVNISQDQLAGLLKAAESLQIKGLSESKTSGSSKTDSRQQKVVPQVTAQPTDIPHASSGLTIEKNKVPRQGMAQGSIGDLAEDSGSPQIPKGLSSREGSQSPTSRKRKRFRRRSIGDDNSVENHEASNSSDMPQQMGVPALGIAPVADEKAHADSTDSIGGRSALMTQLTKPADEMLQLPLEKPEPNDNLIEPKSEYLEDPEESVEDLTLDDDMNDLNEMEQDNNRAGPSHDPSQHPAGIGAWHVTGDRSNAGGVVGSVAGAPGTTDEVFLAAQEAAQAHRDSQGIRKKWSGIVIDKATTADKSRVFIVVGRNARNEESRRIVTGHCEYFNGGPLRKLASIRKSIEKARVIVVDRNEYKKMSRVVAPSDQDHDDDHGRNGNNDRGRKNDRGRDNDHRRNENRDYNRDRDQGEDRDRDREGEDGGRDRKDDRDRDRDRDRGRKGARDLDRDDENKEDDDTDVDEEDDNEESDVDLFDLPTDSSNRESVTAGPSREPSKKAPREYELIIVTDRDCNEEAVLAEIADRERKRRKGIAVYSIYKRNAKKALIPIYERRRNNQMSIMLVSKGKETESRPEPEKRKASDARSGNRKSNEHGPIIGGKRIQQPRASVVSDTLITPKKIELLAESMNDAREKEEQQLDARSEQVVSPLLCSQRIRFGHKTVQNTEKKKEQLSESARGIAPPVLRKEETRVSSTNSDDPRHRKDSQFDESVMLISTPIVTKKRSFIHEKEEEPIDPKDARAGDATPPLHFKKRRLVPDNRDDKPDEIIVLDESTADTTFFTRQEETRVATPVNFDDTRNEDVSVVGVSPPLITEKRPRTALGKRIVAQNEKDHRTRQNRRTMTDSRSEESNEKEWLDVGCSKRNAEKPVVVTNWVAKIGNGTIAKKPVIEESDAESENTMDVRDREGTPSNTSVRSSWNTKDSSFTLPEVSDDVTENDSDATLVISVANEDSDNITETDKDSADDECARAPPRGKKSGPTAKGNGKKKSLSVVTSKKPARGKRRSMRNNSIITEAVSVSANWVDVENLDEHMFPFTCKYCGKKFRRMAHLTRHVSNNCLKNPESSCNSAASRERYICHTCGRRFTKEKSLSHHWRHECQKYVLCKLCNTTLAGSTVSARHLQSCKRKAEQRKRLLKEKEELEELIRSNQVGQLGGQRESDQQAVVPETETVAMNVDEEDVTPPSSTEKRSGQSVPQNVLMDDLIAQRSAFQKGLKKGSKAKLAKGKNGIEAEGSGQAEGGKSDQADEGKSDQADEGKSDQTEGGKSDQADGGRSSQTEKGRSQVAGGRNGQADEGGSSQAAGGNSQAAGGNSQAVGGSSQAEGGSSQAEGGSSQSEEESAASGSKKRNLAFLAKYEDSVATSCKQKKMVSTETAKGKGNGKKKGPSPMLSDIVFEDKI